MRNLLIVFFLFPYFINAQNPLRYEGVVSVDSVSQHYLKQRAKAWVVSVYNHPTLAIQSETDDHISIKTSIDYYQKKEVWTGSNYTKGYIDLTVYLYFKDGRYKYIIKDFYHDPLNGTSFGTLSDSELPDKKLGWISGGTKKWRKLIWDDLKENAKLYAAFLVNDIEAAMKVPSESEKTW